MLPGDQHHHPPLRKDTVSTLVTPDPHASPWIAAGDHRGSRAPANSAAPFEYLNLTGRTRLSASLSYWSEAFSENVFFRMRFPSGLA